MKGLYTPESLAKFSKENESPLREFYGSNMFNPKNSFMRTPDKIGQDQKKVHGYEVSLDNLSLIPPGDRPQVVKSQGKLKQFGK